jgi:enoyl-[acyl-carrier-protein] reductase (NADH)
MCKCFHMPDYWNVRIPLGRTAPVHDVAAAVCYLASRSGDFLTGVVVSIDGGLTMCKRKWQ